MKKNNTGLTHDAIKILQDFKLRQQNGEILDDVTSEALKAIDLAGKVVNTIMSGNQIDPVFFKNLYQTIEQKFDTKKPSVKKVIKKEKAFKKKIKDS